MMDLMQVLSLTADGDDPGRWAASRRPPRHNDEALTGTSRAWLRRLPAGRRPLRLASRYPRVANSLAWQWPDAVQTARLLEELLEDRRGGRRGFPRAVVMELRRLRDYNERGRPEPEGWWEALRHSIGSPSGT